MKNSSDIARKNEPASGVPLWEGCAVDPETGEIVVCPGVSVNVPPIRLWPGTCVRPRDGGTRFQVFLYGGPAEDRWIYTYDYAPEGNWAPLRGRGEPRPWHEGEVRLEEDGYYRFVIAGAHGDWLEELLVLDTSAAQKPAAKRWIGEETERLRARLSGAALPGGFRCLLLADTHYAAGGNWEDTLESLRQGAERLAPEGIVHLGDLTDGMYALPQTKYYARLVMDGLNSLGRPVYMCLGNHDENYFRGNTGVMTKEESAAFYLGREKPYYLVDLPEHKLRLFFLDSFDPARNQRYGFSREELLWFRRMLRRTPKTCRILVFSHVPPLPEIHVWSDVIRNGQGMIRALRRFESRGGRVLAWIHGHSHADQVYTGAEIPVVGIGCGKLECFTEHKPDGSVIFRRDRGSASQELWDVLCVPDGADELYLFRYGAGEDRHITR
jgi:hypothetical protein